MFWIRRTLGIVISCWLAAPACAFTFSYGNLFDVKDVQHKDGTLLLPRTNKKYTNVQILSKAVYETLRQCQSDCNYPVAEKEFISQDYRPAKTQAKMLIAQVRFNEDIQLTVLAFKEKDVISVRMPPVVVFKDKELERQVQEYVKQLARQVL